MMQRCIVVVFFFLNIPEMLFAAASSPGYGALIAVLRSADQVLSKRFCSDGLTAPDCPGQAKEALALCPGHGLLVVRYGNTCTAPLVLDRPSLEGQCLFCDGASLSRYGLQLIAFFFLNSVEAWGQR